MRAEGERQIGIGARRVELGLAREGERRSLGRLGFRWQTWSGRLGMIRHGDWNEKPEEWRLGLDRQGEWVGKRQDRDKLRSGPSTVVVGGHSSRSITRGG